MATAKSNACLSKLKCLISACRMKRGLNVQNWYVIPSLRFGLYRHRRLCLKSTLAGHTLYSPGIVTAPLRMAGYVLGILRARGKADKVSNGKATRTRSVSRARPAEETQKPDVSEYMLVILLPVRLNFADYRADSPSFGCPANIHRTAMEGIFEIGSGPPW